MVRLEEIYTTLLGNPIENNPLSSSLPSLPQINTHESSSFPSLHTFTSQIHTFPSPPYRDLPPSVAPHAHDGSASSTDGRREMQKKKMGGEKMAAWNRDCQEDEEHRSKLEQRMVVKIHQASPREGRLLRRANRSREVKGLTMAWCHQQPFGREVAREVRRLYGITRDVAVLGWLLAGGELFCRAVLWLLYKLPLPTVVHNLFRWLDEGTCSGLQWIEGTRQAARRGERCPAWRRVVGALVAAGVAPPAVLWGRWLSRQQRLFLQEAGVPCPPSEDSQWGILGTSADILLEILAEISTGFLGRAATEQDHNPAVALEPALDTVAEEDEEGCHECDDRAKEEDEETIPLWELSWPDDEVVMGGSKEDLPNEEIKLNIANEMDTLHDSSSKKKDTRDRVVNNEYSVVTCGEDASRLRTQHRRNYRNETQDEALNSTSGLFYNWLPSPPLAFSTHTSSQTLPWPPGVGGSFCLCRSQDPAWEILLQLYCSLFRMMFIIPILLMTVVRPDLHREEDDHCSSSSDRLDHAQAYDEGGRSPLPALGEHCGRQWNDVQPQHSLKKTNRSDQRRRSNLSSNSSDDVGITETPGIEPKRSSDGGANGPIKRRVVTGGKKHRPSNSKMVSQETHDFIEPGLSDYEEEMWLQLGIRPQESKKRNEEVDIKHTHEDDFETWLNDEGEECFKDTPDVNSLDEINRLHNGDNVEFENDVRSKANVSGQCATHMPEEFNYFNITTASMSVKKNLTTELSMKLHSGRGSDEDVSEQNRACESQKPSLTGSFTYILRTQSDNLDTSSIPEASSPLSSEYDMKAVKDQNNCKTRTELLYVDNESEILSSDCKNISDVTNRSGLAKTAPTKIIHRGAKIGKPVARRLHTESNLNSGINNAQKLDVNQFRRTVSSMHKTSLKPIEKINPPKQKSNASKNF